jgi:serpin B
MMSRLILTSIVCLLSAACGADSDPSQHTDAPSGVRVAKSSLARSTTPSDDNVAALGASNRAFAFDLFHQVASTSEGQNMVFSPYSLSSALAMAYAGARTKTEAEIKTTLHFDLEQPQLHEAFNAVDLALAARGAGQVGADGTPFRLNVNNLLWAQNKYPVEETFLDTIGVNYGAAVYLADFAANPEGSRAAINTWVSDQTEKLIPQLLPKGSITTLTRFVLTNTVYLNASWLGAFDPKRTTSTQFTKLDGAQVSASLMHGNVPGMYAAGDSYQAIEIPYLDDTLMFIAVLPDAGAYESVEAGLSPAWFDALQAAWTGNSVGVGLPRLDFKAHTALVPQLKALGMHAAFEDADFSGMTDGDVRIDDVIHEAVLSVFEGGTIATAASAVIFATKSGSSLSVTLDRPFLFAIVDQPTGELLFLGRVLDPSAE